MEVANYTLTSKEDIDKFVDNILDYYRLQAPTGVDVSSILDYKKDQVKKFVGEATEIAVGTLMEYLSCPLAVEDKDNMFNHGLITLTFPRNVKLDEAISNTIMYNAIVRTTPYYEYTGPVTLPNKEDALKCYGTQLIGNSSLLVYLFMTGRGDEFKEVFGDTDFLEKIESGQFDEFSLKEVVNARKTEGKELDSNFRTLITSDLSFVKAKKEAEKKQEEEEKVIPIANTLSKGA